jgi:uncharacterized protein
MGTGQARAPEPFTREQRLLDAARRGDRKTVERALELGVSVHSKDELGRSALLLASYDANDLDLVELLRSRGAELDEPDVQGRAAVSFAAAEGRIEMVRYLLEHGVQADRPDGLHRTPLFHASLGGHADVIALLIDRGADVNAADQFGDTPLMVACAKGHADAAALLLARGADPARKDQEGRTARSRSAPGVAPCQNLPPS